MKSTYFFTQLHLILFFVVRQSIAQQGSCGISGFAVPKVVGGQNANAGDWPWAAAIYSQDIIGVQRFICGGALISNDYVLTAAHCVTTAGLSIPGTKYLVRLNVVDLLSNTDGTKFIEVVSAIPHENYNPITVHNDIAVLKLATAVASIQPVCLPTKNDIQNDFAGINATLIGWGSLSAGQPPYPILQQVSIPVQKQAVCEKAYGTILNPQPIIDSQMCAGPIEGGTGSCNGDSGGPLMWKDESLANGPWIVIGIVSYGVPCAIRGYPGVYSRVTSYLDWINNTMSQ